MFISSSAYRARTQVLINIELLFTLPISTYINKPALPFSRKSIVFMNKSIKPVHSAEPLNDSRTYLSSNHIGSDFLLNWIYSLNDWLMSLIHIKKYINSGETHVHGILIILRLKVFDLMKKRRGFLDGFLLTLFSK
jgi:hypothetical protein